MATDYLLWPKANTTPYASILGNIRGFGDLYSMWGGKSVSMSFPPDAEFPMDPDFPDNTVLADTLMNSQYLIVGSEPLKDFFEARKVADAEYLKVGIRDHKGKIAAFYWIINPVVSLDCLDREASSAMVSRVDKTQVIKTKRTILKEDALDLDRQLFRIAGYPQGILVRRDLASAISEAGFKGIEFRELDQKGQ